MQNLRSQRSSKMSVVSVEDKCCRKVECLSKPGSKSRPLLRITIPTGDVELVRSSTTSSQALNSGTELEEITSPGVEDEIEKRESSETKDMKRERKADSCAAERIEISRRHKSEGDCSRGSSRSKPCDAVTAKQSALCHSKTGQTKADNRYPSLKIQYTIHGFKSMSTYMYI